VAAVAEIHRAEGHRINVTSSHPALTRHCERSPRWKLVNVKKSGGSRRNPRFPADRSAAGRAVVSFEYVGGGEVSGVGCQVSGKDIVLQRLFPNLTPPFVTRHQQA
jgi:hypothetical protein